MPAPPKEGPRHGVPRDLEDAQWLHDVLEIAFRHTSAEMDPYAVRQYQAVHATLCWILGHDSQHQAELMQAIDDLVERARAAGVEMPERPKRRVDQAGGTVH